MARANLGALLGNLPDDSPPTTAAESPAPAPEPTDTPAPLREVAPRAPKPPRIPRAEALPTAEPGYLGFVRKDTRLREDQLEQLTRESRRLNRAKRNTGVRITDNTLIRIGVDLLLARIENATGDDEAAILRSLL